MKIFSTISDAVIEHLQLIIFNLLIIVFSNLSMVYIVSSMYTEKTVYNIEKNIAEYEEVDVEHLCALSNCLYINYNGTAYKNMIDSNDGVLLRATESNVNSSLFKFSEHGHITKTFDIRIDLHHDESVWVDGWVIIDYTYLLDILKNYMLYVIIIFVILNFGLLLSSISHHNKQLLMTVNTTKAEAYSKNVVILTENIHHELNTPLAVITNKINKLEKQFSEFANPSCSIKYMCENQLCNTEKDFKLINYSIHQILDILNVMKQFKGFKKEDDKSLYDIIETTVHVLLVVQPEKFKFDIDDNLRNYVLNHKYISNGEITSIILNMCKNAIDAEGTFIKFTDFNNGSGFYIADNGNGIDPKIINRIYDEDFTTKDGDIIRGNGLFVNKSTLDKSSGSLDMIRTDKSGTIFRIKLKTLKLENI